MVRENPGRIQVPGGDAAHDALVQGGGSDFVAHQESAAQHLETPFQQHLGADARDGRRHGAHEGDAGRQGGADLVQHGCVPESEYLGQDDEVLVLVQDADVPDDFFPVFVHGAGDVDRTHLAGTQPQMLHFRQAHKADAAGCSGLFQRLGDEGAVEVVETREIDDEGLFRRMLVREYGDVLQGEGGRPEGTHRHQLEAVHGIGPDTGRRKEGGHPVPGRADVLEIAGEEMHRVLSGAYDRDFPARLLEADAGGEA